MNGNGLGGVVFGVVCGRGNRPWQFLARIQSLGKLNMLQFNKTHSAGEDYGRVSAGTSSPAELLENLLGILRRQYAVILFVGVLTMALALIYVVTATPKFTAVATMFIDRGKFNPLLSSSKFSSTVRSIPRPSRAKSRSSNPTRLHFR